MGQKLAGYSGLVREHILGLLGEIKEKGLSYSQAIFGVYRKNLSFRESCFSDQG